MTNEDNHDAHERLEAQVNKLRYAVFGFDGTNGINGRVRELERARDKDQEEKLASQRAVLLGALAAIIALIGTLVQLILAVSGG
jgi:hypothetical protein